MNFKNTYMKCYNPSSAGAKELSRALGITRIREQGSRFIPGPGKTIINWGCSAMPNNYATCKVINSPFHVSVATNKLKLFELIGDRVSMVPFTTDREKVKEWLSNGQTVCARTKLRASGGDGLVLFDAMDSFVEAPLYTLYIKKKDEFRIHVIGGEVASIQRKGLRKEDRVEDADHRIRNLANGYVFIRNDVNPPADVLDQAVLSCKLSGLDFGAVDVIFNDKQKKAYVLEINTAAGLEGQTIEHYKIGLTKILTT